MCAQGRGRPPHGPAASPDSTESPRYSGRPSPALLPIPDSFSQLRLEARRSMLPLPQASPRALSAKRRQHRINPSRDKRFILEREEIAQALPERTRAAPDATGASPAGCREGACGVASPRWARWAESWAGHPAPEMRELARGRLCGRLGGAFCTGHGGGCGYFCIVKVQARDRTNSVSSVGGPGGSPSPSPRPGLGTLLSHTSLEQPLGHGGHDEAGPAGESP